MKKFLGIFVIILVALLISVPADTVHATGGSATLSSTYAGGNSCNGSMFNFFNYNSLTITGLWQHIDSGAGATPWVYVYYRYGAYAGFETSSGSWSTWTSVQVTNQGTGVATYIPLPDWTLPTGTSVAVYVHIDPGTFTGVAYTNGSTDYSDSNLYIDNGVGVCGFFGASSVVADRIWNGSLDYVCTCLASAGSPSLTSPLHKAHTTDTTPTFFWSNVSNYQSYRFMIYTEDRSFEFKQRIFTNSFTPPALVQQKYLWRVRTQDATCSTWSTWSGRYTIFID